MIKLSEKIKQLMKEKGIKSLYKLHQILVKEFGKQALSRRSLTTIMNQQVVIRSKVIHQLCHVFNIIPLQLIKETNIAPYFKDIDHLKIYDKNKIVFSINALFQGPPYSVEKVFLRPGQRTPQITANPGTIKNTSVSIYVLRGTIDFVEIDKGKYRKRLKAGEFFEYNFKNSHYFENTSTLLCSLIFICCPPELSLRSAHIIGSRNSHPKKNSITKINLFQVPKRN
jgi:hypothetical protein